MAIVPHHHPVSTLFSHDKTFRVPKYQRYYAWGEEQIDDFINDLEACRATRAAGRVRPHFLGGLVTVSAPIAGSPRTNLDVIDGQQRLSTITMLMSQVRRAMEALAGQVDPAAPDSPLDFLMRRAELLKAYEWFDDAIGVRVVTEPRLVLSKPDKDFFGELLRRRNPVPTRESHRLLAAAFRKLGTYVDGLVATGTDVEKAEQLARIADVMSSEWTVIHMAADTQSEAFMLFQVLNDRGTGLTEGILLRAKTLEMLEAGGDAAQLSRVEDAWDRMLEMPSDRVEENLRWIYTSHQGVRPGKTTLFDEYLDARFPQHRLAALQPGDAAAIVDEVVGLEEDFRRIERMRSGDWPYPQHAANVTLFERDRLAMLLVELKFSITMPLLVAAGRLTQPQFARIVHAVERFMFRYKAVVNARVEPAMNIFYRNAVAIRADPAGYNVATLETELRTALTRYADDARFIARLREISYGAGGGNKPLKYLLLTLDHYVRWMDQGAAGRPRPDMTWVDDFGHATLEHIHARNPGAPDPPLDEVVDTLGNLAVLSQADNDAAGNQPFALKRPIFARSSSPLNSKVGALPGWDRAAVDARRNYLEQLARAVFSV